MEDAARLRRRIERARRCYRRQPNCGWIERYQPAILANRTEAPSTSRPSVLCDVNRVGREIHVLSEPERNAALVALWHARLVNLEEQKVLQPLADVHPLHGHPAAQGQVLNSVPGTFWAYDQLGQRARHPTIRIREADGRTISVADYLIGDLLLTLRDDQGVYCVNWNVKNSEEGFGTVINPSRTSWQRLPDSEKAALRAAAEELYYAHAAIPTYRITRETFAQPFVDNLLSLFCWQARRKEIADVDLQGFAPTVRASIQGSIALEYLRRIFTVRYRRPDQHFRTALAVLIWDQSIRVDLFTRIFLDGCLLPERTDPAKIYGHLFTRGEQ